MIVPNLATQPFLNTRPVWLATFVAGLLALVFSAVNIHLYLTSREEFAIEYQRRQELSEQYQELEAEVRALLRTLNGVPWRTLDEQVERFNIILREHSFSWLALLGDIEAVMPYGVRLARISPKISEEGIFLSLVAVSRDREAMLEFLDNLITDPNFSAPLPRNEITPEGGSSSGYTLDLEVTYHGQEVSS